MKKIIIGAIAALVLMVGFVAYQVTSTPSPVNVGSNSAGPEHSNQEFFNGGLVVGGGVRATSTTGTVVPLLASDVMNNGIIDVTLNQQDATLSFPASSTLKAYLPVAGMRTVLFIHNATTTATMDIAVTGGTGVILKRATTSSSILGDTDASNYARLEIIRKANTDFSILMQIFED